ncbi:MAG: BrnT family toxin [Thermodesulfobacteriota bacterium]|nr:BrnT family toxin [Thermodesulfobacteriota bacterium]
MNFVFEWDENKAEINKRVHKVSFDEAQTVFIDDLSIMQPDVDHSVSEERLLIIGTSNKNRVLIVSYTERRDNIRIISAGKSTRNEREQYEEDYF